MKVPAVILGLITICLTGCGTPGAPLPPSLNIPKAVDDLQAVRKGESVTLTWTAPDNTTDGALIRKPGKMVIHRSTNDRSTTSVAGELALPPSTKTSQARTETFKDPLTEVLRSSSADFAVYTVEALSNSGKSAGPSNQMSVPLAPTPATPSAIELNTVPQGISITWQQVWPPENRTHLTAHYAYRIMRRQEGPNQQPVLVKELGAGNTAALVIDAGIEWQKQYQYWVTPVTTWESGTLKGEVQGDDSPMAPITANDTFPPAVPTGLQAVFSGVPQQPFIDLTWTPNTDSDLAGYNVSRRTEGLQLVKINTEVVKTPAFRDK